MDERFAKILTNSSLLKQYISINLEIASVDYGGRAYKRLSKDEEIMRNEILKRMEVK